MGKLLYTLIVCCIDKVPVLFWTINVLTDGRALAWLFEYEARLNEEK